MPSRPFRLQITGLLFAAAALGGCAVTTVPGGTVAPPPSKLKRPLPTSTETGTMANDGRYQLSADEMTMNCQKLTGRVQVRLLQLRDSGSDAPSSTARTVQGTVTTLFGGTSHGVEPALERQRDMALLEAYNRRLAEKNCPTYDLTRELQLRDAGDALPRPIIPAKTR